MSESSKGNHRSLEVLMAARREVSDLLREAVVAKPLRIDQSALPQQAASHVSPETFAFRGRVAALGPSSVCLRKQLWIHGRGGGAVGSIPGRLNHALYG